MSKEQSEEHDYEELSDEEAQKNGPSVLDSIRSSLRLKTGTDAKILTEEDSDSDKNASAVQTSSSEHNRKSMSYMDEAMYLDNCRESALKSLKNFCQEFSQVNGAVLNAVNFPQLFSKIDLLKKLFQLFDYSVSGFLKQQDLIDLLKQKIGTEKGLEFAELIETVCYVICGQEDLSSDAFVRVFTSRGVLAKFYKLIDTDAVGYVTTDKIMEFLVQLTNRRTKSEITEEQWKNLEQVFRQRMKDDRHIYLDDFKKLIQTKNDFFAERVFSIFDKDGSGSISLTEFKESIQQFCGKSVDDKTRFLFQIYDIDGDSLINQEELKSVLRACMEENGMKFSEEQLDDLTVALYDDANTDDNSQGISFEELKGQLQKHPALLDNLSITIDRWLTPVKVDGNQKRLWPSYRSSVGFMKNNAVFLVFMFCFVGVNAALFISRAIQFVQEDKNVFFVLAKGAGQTLNFNSAFILVLMLRQSITFLRTHGWANVLPLDHHIYFHKVCGVFIFGFSMLHTAMHCTNFPLNVAPGSGFSAYQWLFTMKPKLFGLIPGIANPTGWPLVAILFVMVLCSMPFVRRYGNFEVFYWTHLLYVPYWILLLLHGPNFWKWFVGPGIIFVVERLIRLVRMKTGRGKTYITSGILLPSRVTHLEIKKPDNFHFHPGDYVFVNIPKIAKMEWHPLTISSAPEKQDTFSLHIRGVGGWTNRLYDYFEKEQAKLICKAEQRDGGGTCEGCRKLLEPPPGPMESIRRSLSMLRTPRQERKAKLESHGHHSCRLSKSVKRTTSSGTQAVASRLRNQTCAISMPDTLDSATVQFSNNATNDTLTILRDPSNSESAAKRTRSADTGYRYLRNPPPIISILVPAPSSESMKHAVTPRLSYAPDTERKKSVAVELELATHPVNDEPTSTKPLEVVIDGPYGAPSSHIFRAEHAVLIGTGIGVTPFASILQSIMHRYWRSKQICPRCSYSWNCGMPESVMNLRKVDFFWINREQRSFEWFVELLSQLEMEQAELGGAMERFLDMHMYITSALQRTDMKAVGLQLALDLLHQKEKRDLVTGLKTRTNAGRPNWKKVFQQLLDENKGKITVFYCGPPQLAKTLKELCDELCIDFRKEIF